MSAKGYTTEEKIEAMLGVAITDGAVARYIEAAEKLIDKLTGRNFIADSVAVARDFDGTGKQEMYIDDCIEITKVELGNDAYGDNYTEISAGGSNGYYLHPVNYKVEELPIRAIHLRSNVWLNGLSNNKITAKWGYSESVPADIEFIATVLAAGMYQFYKKSGFKGAKSEKIGNYSVSYKNDNGWSDYNLSIELIEQYKKLYF